jgi:TonB family protein
VTHYKLPPQPKPKPEKNLVVPPPVKPLVVKPPEVKPPEPKLPEPPKVVKLPDVIDRPLPPRNTPHLNETAPTPAPPKMEVKTGGFSTATLEKPTTSLPPSKVQTGGFGDPEGIKGVGKPGKPGNIASLGSFDLPVGAGAGNGTGGASGSKGIVASAGFGSGGSGAGSSNGGGSGSQRVVQQGGFGDAENAKPEAPKKRVDTGPPQTPVEIVFKPKPDYTDDARRIKLEGEVLLRVLFTASGEVRVLGVASGLGHGLDESAIRASQQIKFKPAMRNGQPVDSTATVHIVFQLAY